jgi:hypothetical protein
MPMSISATSIARWKTFGARSNSRARTHTSGQTGAAARHTRGFGPRSEPSDLIMPRG